MFSNKYLRLKGRLLEKCLNIERKVLTQLAVRNRCAIGVKIGKMLDQKLSKQVWCFKTFY